tara:strand:+ start:4927 stop:5334 length:408 start_codon:yes stop_codon:yes gene_type:complete
MNTQQIEKALKRLNEIKTTLDSNLSLENRSDLIHKMTEIQFKLNKVNIKFILKCKNKYYYANQCAAFTGNVLNFGYGRLSKETISKEGISFNKYSINLGPNQYGQDLKEFNSTAELLGFVIGYNECIEQSTNLHE